MTQPLLIPPKVAESLSEIERAVQRFRACYGLGADPESLLAEEIIGMRIELLKLWSLVAAESKANA